jgi:hypothetical protein
MIRLGFTTANEMWQTEELEKYKAQLDRFIQHLRPFGINLQRDTPIEKQELPDSAWLLRPRAGPEGVPMRLETRTYMPPLSPRKVRKRTRTRKPRPGFTAKDNAELKKKSRGQAAVSSEDDEDSDAHSSDSSPLPASKRLRVGGRSRGRVV